MRSKSYNFKILIYSTLLIMFTSSVYSQAGKAKVIEIFNKTQGVYEKSKRFKLSSLYKMYPTASSTKMSEQCTGVLFKNGTDFYSKIAETEFIKINSTHIKIDMESKLMQLSFDNEGVNSQLDLKSFISNFEKFEVITSGKEWKCILTAPKISFVPYGKVIIYINKLDYTITKQELFLLKQVPYLDKNGKQLNGYPRMEIMFSDFSTKNIDVGSMLSLDNYVEKKDKKIVPSKNYKNYRIVD